MDIIATITRSGLYEQEIRYETLQEARDALASRFRGSALSKLALLREMNTGEKLKLPGGILIRLQRAAA